MTENGFDYVASPSDFARSKYFYALIGGYSVPDERFHFERAYYPAYEALIITSGKGWYRHGREWLGLTAGDCLLHNMRYPHAYKADPDDPFQMTYLVFDGHLLDKLWPDNLAAPYVLFRPVPLSALTEIVDRILTAMRNDDRDPDGTELQISCLIYQLMVQCLHQSQGDSQQADLVKPDAMTAAQRFLNEHYLTVEKMEDAAKGVNLSFYHFIRQFKRYFGRTPKEYVLLKRVNHAKQLLLLTNRSVTEIAALSGFNNYNSFLHAFHQIERRSPTDYRKTKKK
ncbi:AraC family transcriptional regulator [Paenibacillus spongiae]|uniref:AraC family transcriptional regulator n=1 Tax=Paenibacillus spongiae TaxID=2909671 RepID=A0ABY5S665_9BACL|nr:AraC family transcriptional regulator [Paenibacillus spongiae]UVI28347.1 AraC family transcriptional regulator [Paenibacillus spongiae]